MRIGVRAQDCFTPEHTGLMVLGGFGLVVYVIGCAQSTRYQCRCRR